MKAADLTYRIVQGQNGHFIVSAGVSVDRSCFIEFTSTVYFENLNNSALFRYHYEFLVLVNSQLKTHKNDGSIQVLYTELALYTKEELIDKIVNKQRIFDEQFDSLIEQVKEELEVRK